MSNDAMAPLNMSSSKMRLMNFSMRGSSEHGANFFAVAFWTFAASASMPFSFSSSSAASLASAE